MAEATKISSHLPAAEGGDAPQTVRLCDEQFDAITELLRPGYEMANLMLADYKAQHEQPADTADADETKPAA